MALAVAMAIGAVGYVTVITHQETTKPKVKTIGNPQSVSSYSQSRKTKYKDILVESPEKADVHSQDLRLVEMLKQLDKHQGKDGLGDLIADISMCWSEIDPEGCYEWAMSMPSHLDRYVALLRLSEILVKNGNVDSLNHFIASTPKGELKDVLIKSNFAGLARLDMNVALALSGDLGSAGATSSSAHDLAQVLFHGYDSSDWGEIIENLKHGSFRESVVYELISKTAKKDANEALLMFNEFAPNSREHIGFSMSAIASQLVV